MSEVNLFQTDVVAHYGETGSCSSTNKLPPFVLINKRSRIPTLRALAVLAGHGLHSASKEDAQQALDYLYQIRNPSASVEQLITDAKRQLAKDENGRSR